MLPLISQLSTAAKTAPILPKIPPPQQPHPFLLPRSLIRSFLHAPGRARDARVCANAQPTPKEPRGRQQVAFTGEI